jgi:RNA-directed DNA polymerase
MRLFPIYTGPSLIEQICQVDTMTRAYRHVRDNIASYRRGRSAGPDGVTLSDFDADWPNQMAQLADELRTGTYRPLPPHRIDIPKKSGGTRAIAIMSIRDRIAQRATLQVLDPLFDPFFQDCSFGCRPRIGVSDAIERVARYAEQGYSWVVDADIADYFNHIDQRILLNLLRQRIPEMPVIQLIAQWLDSGMQQTDEQFVSRRSSPFSLWDRGSELFQQFLHREEDSADPPMPDPNDPYRAAYWGAPAYSPKRNPLWEALLVARPLLATAHKALPYLQKIDRRTMALTGAGAVGIWAAYEFILHRANGPVRGTVQGGPLSPLLANIYLHPFDLALRSRGLRLVRFMDDFVILCASQQEAEAALQFVETQLKALHLELNPQKTAIRQYADGIDFLGQSLAPARKGRRLEDGLSTFAQANKALRNAVRQAKHASKSKTRPE